MRLLLPDNIFSAIFLSEINITDNINTELLPSAVISAKLVREPDVIGFIPSLDLLTFKDFFVSGDIGFSFNALLSNSYLYFKENQQNLKEIMLYGDVTANEVILSKILFEEFYDTNVKTTLLSSVPEDFNRNILIAGDFNFKKELFAGGLSLSEEIIELIKAPYINFVLAGNSENSIKKFSSDYLPMFDKGHAESFDHLFPNLSPVSVDYINLNIQHLVFDLDQQDIEGIKLLLEMPYYHGIIKDMVEVKFV